MAQPAPAFDMDPEEEAAFLAAVHEGVMEADAGLFAPLDEVSAWLLSWGKEDELPAPL